MRLKKHPPYYRIKGYQIIENLSDSDLAAILGISTRTFRDKRDGYSDFSLSQGDLLAKALRRSKDDIFLT